MCMQYNMYWINTIGNVLVILVPSVVWLMGTVLEKNKSILQLQCLSALIATGMLKAVLGIGYRESWGIYIIAPLGVFSMALVYSAYRCQKKRLENQILKKQKVEEERY